MVPEVIEQAALRLLSRREHSRAELRRKLSAKVDEPDQLERVINALVRQGYQSDTRFAKQYILGRKQKGFGPIRIRLELQERGVEADVIETYLNDTDPEWQALLTQAWHNKFGDNIPGDFKAQAKQARFLEYRGFPAAWVRQYIWHNG